MLVVLAFVSWVVLQSKQFQNWAIDKVTTRLSKDLNTEVDVAHIDIDFFNKLVLEGFYVEDQQGDTLLYSRKLKTSLSANLLAILGKDLNIDDVDSDASLHDVKKDARVSQFARLGIGGGVNARKFFFEPDVSMFRHNGKNTIVPLSF